MAVEIWTFSALIGASAAIYGAAEAYLDLRALGDIRNGARLVARQRLFAQSVRSVITLSWLALGAGLWLSGVRAEFSVTVIVLILGNVLTTVIALSDAIVGRILRS